MIDDEINGAERVDFLGVTTHTGHGVSHGSEIDNSRHTSEVLKNNSCGAEGDFDVVLGSLGPVENLLDVGLLDGEVVAVTDGGLEEDTDGVRELLDTGVTEGGELVEVVLLTGVLDGALDGLVKGVRLG